MRRVCIVFCSILLIILGLLMVFDTSWGESLNKAGEVNVYRAFFKQSICASIGMFLAFFCYRLGYIRLLAASSYLFWIITALLALVFIFGHEVNGAKRWIYLFGFSLQPGEWLKLILPMSCIEFLRKRENQLTFRQFLKQACIFSIPIIFIFFQPDNGTVFVLILIIGAPLFLSNVPLRYWLLPIMVAMFFGSIVASKMPHVRDRIWVYLHPEVDLKGKGHQPFQAKIAVGSGKVFGKGFGKSLQKMEYLPEAQNDYIIAILAEEVGFLGMLILISVYLSLIAGGFSIARAARDRIGFRIASILTFSFAMQVFLNLGIVCGIIPPTGMTLPLFSQGGTSMMVQIISLGIILSVDKSSEKAFKKVKNFV